MEWEEKILLVMAVVIKMNLFVCVLYFLGRLGRVDFVHFKICFFFEKVYEKIFMKVKKGCLILLG